MGSYLENFTGHAKMERQSFFGQTKFKLAISQKFNNLTKFDLIYFILFENSFINF